ncbi:non-ribosomal peptide synthase/polyketide synthase [Pseudomonas fluorescens]|uniref:non-ribosomal peptide synthase/polyketide synthase n=2 Tax=Gammaproteobacteria TaxID=1236 RepID=UPI0005C5CEAD|nr:non-ribosomal peptide synthase/polyketide synthase [Pseudomonas fluorescens]
MNAEDSLKLARRFIGLPLEKRQLFLQALQKEGVDFSRFPIPAGVEVEDRQALSYAQQRMWFLWQLDPASGAYNLPGAVRLSGVLSLPALEQAFVSLVGRHETLRTVFQRQADERLAQVAVEPSVTVEHLDFTALAFDAREQAVNAAATRQSLLPFDLEHGPLLRVQLLKLAEQEHVLLLTLHHIVSDGWSMNVLIDEFIRCYDAHERNEAPQLPALPIQYSDYALWQRRWLEAGEQARQLEYWQARLGDEHPVLELPTDHTRPAMPSYQGTRHNFAVEPALAAQLRSCAQKHNVTLFMLLLGAFNVLLHRYTGQGDIRVGVPIANRNRTEVEGLIGFFVNTQVLRTELSGQTRVAELLQGIKEHALGAQAHQELPFERLVEALKIERSLSHTPLFQVMYNHQPVVADIASVSTASGLELALVEWQGRTTQFDLTLDTYEKSGTLHAALTYANDLFDMPTIERMARHWTRLLQAMVLDGEQRIGELPMLDAGEQQRLVHTWNQTAEAYPTERGVHHLIEDQARRSPDAPALVFGTTTLTYAQLDARANQLAHALGGQGVGPDVLVGICIERSIEMVVGLLAILKAGGAYVPLDPEYPQERLAYMIEDSGIQLLLSQQSLLASLPVAGIQVIALDQPALWLDGYSSESPNVALHALNLAYVIYTSGSTGKPKGAGNSQRALVNRLSWMQQAYGLGANDAVLQKTPFSFDVSVWEFFWPLMTGARLVVAAPGEHREPARLIDTIGRHAITTLHFVPSMLQAFIHEPGVQACASLTRIVCSGEALPLDAQQQVFAKLPTAVLYNLYGPTEAAIDVTHWTCIDEGADSVPIGRPIANLGTYVLDAQLNPVPAGVSGELYLGGVGLARSYHRRPALTAERFVPNPFVTGERLYRTGDRVRQRADGVIEYLGRLDHQVKLRGLRIELGEIEARLMQHPHVREAVVLVHGGKQLVAYLVHEGEAPTDLKAWLLTSLPEYMVPTHFIALPKLPVTANGKLDRKALPVPDAALQQAFVAPQGVLQTALAAIWSDVLGVEQVGQDDNFFELGGDSIISIQVVSRARQAGIRLSPRDLFQYQSIRSLALVARLEQVSLIDQGPVSGEVMLTPIQHSFFDQPIPARHHWNQSLLLVPGEVLEPARLEAALARLTQHHDALRLRFVQQADGWQQSHTAYVSEPLLWQCQASTDAELAALCDEAQRSLDLAQGPLLRAALVNMADGSQRVLLVIHHLVVDGVSWRILFEDLQQAYREQALSAKTTAYQHWAQQLHSHAQTLDEQLPYWQAQSIDAELPCDHPEGGLQNRLGAKLETRLDAEHTRRLLQDAPAAYRTQVNDLLLTALARVISRWSEQPAALIQLEGHGREDLFDDIDLSRTVGWFTSLYPVRLHAEGELSAAIKSVKEQLRAVPNKGIGYGLLRYLGTPDTREALSILAAPRITFNYLGQFDRQFNESALLVPATQGSGQAQDPEAPLANWLTVEGQVYGGELALQWGFSREMFEAATVQRLADEYAAELKALIEHCCATPAGQVSPSDFPLARLTQPQLDALPVAGPAIADLYPLSPMQQGMLFHTLLEPEAQAYINQLRLDIDGLDLLAFGRAWQAALDRHDILRSSFHWLGLDSAHQLIQRQVDLQLQVIEDPDADFDTLAQAERERGFALNAAPLFRLTLVRGAGAAWHFIFTSHHILMDGWSNAQLLGEVIAHYAGQAVPAPLGQFRDYLAWLQQQSSGEAFWKTALAALPAPTLLAQALRTPIDGAGMADHHVALESDFTRRLGEFARQHKVTLNTLLQGAWSLLLQRYTGQDCVAFGATVAGRSAPLPGIEQQLGLFINTLPIISVASPAQSAATWLSELQALNLSLRDHEHVPLYDIQGWAGQQGALFDTLLVFENFPVAEALKQGAPAGLTFGRLHNHERTHYPLTLGIELGASLRLEFSYDRAQFSEAQVAQLSANLHHLLAQLLADAHMPLGNLRLLDAPTQRQMLALSRSAAAPQANERVHQRIAAQAEATPDALAVQAGDASLSYAQLNQRANRLAHRLLALGVGPGQRVGLASRRGPQLIVSLLAVLKSGAAYVPLDPKYPVERLAYMLADSRLDLLLSETGLLADLPLPQGLTHVDFSASGDELTGYPATNPPNHAAAADLAYVIYTSGSTGQPKGVAIDHAALGQFCDSATLYSRLSAEDRVLQFATFSFDGFVEQCFPPLCAGAALIMRGDELWDAGQLAQEIVKQGVTLADLPAAYWYLLAQECAEHRRSLGKLRQVHVGGEAMSVEGIRAWHAAGLGNVRLVNTYGPTEATVVSSVHDCQLADATDAYGVPIGQAIAGRGLYVLDSGFELLATDGVGELCIGAEVGLAQRYFDRPALTAERFLPDPFSATPGARLYRSGDLARYNPAGALEYVGRIDHQVKIRGLRIEMGEIEASLQALPNVREAAVLAQPSATGAQLVAYVVPAEGQALEPQALATCLRQTLPDYMVPGHWVVLDALPLNHNGKLDRRALPTPDLNQASTAYVAPQSPLQIQLAAIWQAVLQVEQVGLEDHFFERGGHSLLATQVISRVRHDLKLEVPLRALFEQPTLAAFAAACAGVQVDTAPVIQAVGRDQPLALSFAQERQWFLWQLDPTSAAYHVPTALHLRGGLDIAALERAVEALVQRHEPLRTTFVESGEHTVQIIHPSLAVPVEQQKVDADAIEQAVTEEIQRPFDLRNGPLMRVKLLIVAPDHHVLVITQHHIISDGWSMQVMIDEWVALYQGDAGLPGLPIQYADYAQWQRDWMAAGEQQRQLDYWCARLGHEHSLLDLPLDHPRPAVQSHRGARRQIHLERALLTELKALAQRQDVTLFMLLLASFQTLLHRYSGQSQLRVGVPVANRNRFETERLLGFFVNTQVLQADVHGQMPFEQLLAQVKLRALEAQAHQDLPFEQLVQVLQPERSLSHNPLFQVMFNHQDSLRSAPVQLPGLALQPVDWAGHSTQFDLNLETEESVDGLWASLTYATDLFDAATAERLAEHWQNLLRAVLQDASVALDDLAMLSPSQSQQMVHDWNRSDTDYPRERCVHQLFEVQAAAQPDAIALHFNDERLSYGELNRRANRLAHRLIDMGVGPDVLVAVHVERSLDMAVGLLATLKAGGAYVPLDPQFPAERLAYMLEDSGARVLLTQPHLLGHLAQPHGVQVLMVADAGTAQHNPQVAVTPEHLAYVIYTSGSTGKPKGVMVRHKALCSFTSGMAGTLSIGQDARLLSLTTFSFDIFALELYVPLSVGGTVLLSTQATALDPEAILDLAQRQAANVLQATPSTWRMLLDSPRAHSLRGIACLCGGEALPVDLAQRMLDLQGPLWNLYGPTETTIWSAAHRLHQALPFVGRPIANTGLFILNAGLTPCPQGVSGELLIGGVGLARGYHGQPALTAERFVPNPFGAPGERLYRTGDLARYRADGVVEYIGRVDHQVKVRGFRIELGEIEACLRECDGVREAVVLADNDRLIAYLVSAAPQAPQVYKTALRERLPDYMVPAHWMFLDRLPLTPNGKLDRKALPKPDASLSLKDHMAPVTPREQQVAAIWAEVLELPRVGLDDHFFELGGHSLLATRVVSRVRQALGLEVPLKALFEQPLLGDFVRALGEEGVTAPALIKADRTQPLPLSYAQERQWFLWQLDPAGAAYHIPSALRLQGALDLTALQESFDSLMARHESLRTYFRQDATGAVQVIDAQSRVDIEQLDSDYAGLKARVAQVVVQPFDLLRGPLLRVTLLRLAEDDHVLVLVQHHIVSDGWSMQLMVEELVQAYAANSQGQDVQLPTLPIQYADYAVWQRDWMEAAEQARQLAYWREQLSGEQPVLELPFDHPRSAQPSHRGARLGIELHPELLGRLRALAQHAGVTLPMLLLASYQALLHRYSGQEDVRVGVPIANRNRLETEGLIGFFVNTQVLKADIHGQMSTEQLLHQVRQRSLEAQAHQDLPFEQLVQALQPERSLSLSPLFQVLFNHRVSAADSHLHRLADLHVEVLDLDEGVAQFDLALDVEESQTALRASLSYATDLFAVATIERMAGHWQNLLRAMVVDPQQPISQLSLLGEDEQQQILELWNQADAGFSAERLVHELVGDRARETPDAVAVKFDAQTLSYGELDRQANRLAHALIARGVGPEVRVAIAMPRSAESMVAFLAVMKAGGVYVPLDIEYPRDRLLYMMQDSRAQLLLTHSRALQQLPVPEGLDTLAIDRTEEWAGYSDTAPNVALDGDNLAYVIYTSGSTGLPKGVAVSHGPLVAHIIATGERYETSPADCELHFMSFAFDGSHEGWMHPLINGASVLIRDDSLWLPEYTYEQMHRHNVTMAVFPPVYLQQLAEHAERDGNPPPVRVYCFGGDAVAQASYDLAWRALKPKYLFNGYGPTETVVTPLLWKARKGDPCGAVYAPIGTLLGNRSGYVLDAQLNLQPIGVAGELYLGGEGVARGYLERPALTAERFVPDPFGKPGSRVYRSGDLTRGRPDGVVDYLGRVDHQVKVRGFRIELGEIEARLREQDNVGETVVVAQDGPTGKQLVAYVVPAGASLANEAELRDNLRRALKTRLPDYMVPTYFMFLADMPLTPNGKLDRKGLPQPDASLLQQAYVAPQSELEHQLAAIWADVLRLPQVGLNDNFFELGGDSIISIQVVSRARQAGIRFTPKDVFLHQTVQSLAGVARQGVEGPSISQAALSGEAMLLPIQQAFFADEIAERHHWNQSVVLQPHERLDPATLIQALQALIVHHDALRSQFHSGTHGWQSVYRGAEQHQADVVLWQSRLHDIDGLTALGEEAQRSLNLSHGPLMRAMLAQLNDGSQRLLLVIHHLVVDGVSWRVLLEDLQTAYRQLTRGAAVVLPAKTSSTRDWAQRLQQYAQGEALRLELEGWQARLQGAEADLPGAKSDASLSNRYAASATTHLDVPHTRRLLQDAPGAYRTQINDLLLTALARVIGRWTGHASTLIRLEGHGREDLFDDIDLTRTVGWFTSIYPVKLTPEQTLAGSLKGIKEQLRAIPDKGIGFGALRYLGQAPVREAMARLPQPRITFNYLGQFDTSFEGREEQGLFAPSGDAAGADQSPEASLGNWLEINGQVYGGELNMTWSFSQDMFEPAIIQSLADAYADELKAVIEHCCQPENIGATPSDFPLAGLNQAQLDGLSLPLSRVEDIYPLSPMQQGMLFQSLYGQGSGDYINQMRVDIQGLDVARFQAAWQVAMEHHAILRTAFLWQTEFGQPLQVVHKSVNVPLVEHDWQHRVDCIEALDAMAETIRAEGFVLEQAPLLSLVVVRTGPDTHHLVYTNHHILMDGWSASQLFGEVMQHYAGEPARAPNGRYRDYIAWLQVQDPFTSEAFWKAQLAGLREPTRLSRVVKREQAAAQINGIHRLTLERAATEQLKAFAQRHKVTLNTLVQSTWLLLLQRHTGLDTVAFGATVAGRPAGLAGIEQQIGLFINTLPVIATPSPQLSVDAWLQQVQAQNLRLREQEHTPLFEIQRWAGLAGEALFDSILVFENYPVSEALEQGAPAGLRFGEMDSLEQTHYPLTVLLSMGDSLSVEFNYDHASFDKRDITHLAEHFQQLLHALTLAHVERLADLPSLPVAQRKLIVEDWNATAREYPLQRSVHELIEQQVALAPQAPALVFGAQCLSYAQLNCRANRLAHRLIEAGVGPDVLVGLAVDRSIEMVVGLLAVLKAGGAYVPLDPEYPRERLAYMLDDSGVKLLLTQAHLREQLPIPAGLETLVLGESGLEAYSEANPGVALDGENLAYVIYTSGSTGQPKGAGNRHCALTNRLCWMQEAYALDISDTVLQKTPFSFDVSVWEFFWPLMTGARLVVAAPGDHRDPAKLIELINREQVTTLHFVPSMLQAFLQDTGASSCTSLLRVVCSGEALPVDAQQQVFAKLPQVGLYNLYGPTEAAIDVTHWTCLDEGRDAVPIGKPIGNLGCYVLDSNLEPVPAGVLGELFIGGMGLARGYHCRPGLTAERFIAHPFIQGERLYRSGDLARYRGDGVIEYAGRIDHQVKLRGMRIELGEIEARLLEHDWVREAAVLAVDGKHLVGYLVLQAQSDDWRETLSAHLAAHLPDYMVPAQWLVLEQMPLSPNGKLDRKALPKPDVQSTQRFEAPKSEMERKVAAIWSDVLGVESVGVNDNFFELGGHSLRILMLKERIRKASGISLSVSQLMLNPTVRAQVDCLEGKTRRSLLVPLNSCTQGTPLYLFHPSYGSVHCYKAVALALREQRPVVGVICRALAEEGAEVPSWAGMIEDYTAQLLEAQTEGAFRLAGWSLGGNLAVEVAYGLEQAGRQVEFVGWIDASPPRWLAPYWEAAVITDDSEVSDMERRVALLGVMFPAFAEVIQAAWHDLQAGDADQSQQWARFEEWAEVTLGETFCDIKQALLGGNEARVSWEVDRTLFKRMEQADFKPLKAPVSCWWAAMSRAGQHKALIEASMEKVIGGACVVRSVVIDADHERIIDNAEFVRSFVKAME